MALQDWERTRDKVTISLQEKGRTTEWLEENCLLAGESKEDLRSLLREMMDNHTINKYYKTVYLETTKTRAARRDYTLKQQGKNIPADPWAWYASHPDSEDFREQLRANFSHDDGKIFKMLAAILCRERLPRAGERVAGEITEEEGRYITKINEALQAYLREKDS